jgi:hypothetical protein
MSGTAWVMDPIPVISSGHVSTETWRLIQDPPFQLGRLIASGVGFAFVHIGERRLAEDLKRVCEWVDKHYPGSSWVRLDVDGDIIPELPCWYSE